MEFSLHSWKWRVRIPGIWHSAAKGLLPRTGLQRTDKKLSKCLFQKRGLEYISSWYRESERVNTCRESMGCAWVRDMLFQLFLCQFKGCLIEMLTFDSIFLREKKKVCFFLLSQHFILIVVLEKKSSSSSSSSPPSSPTSLHPSWQVWCLFLSHSILPNFFFLPDFAGNDAGDRLRLWRHRQPGRVEARRDDNDSPARPPRPGHGQFFFSFLHAQQGLCFGRPQRQTENVYLPCSRKCVCPEKELSRPDGTFILGSQCTPVLFLCVTLLEGHTQD